jgi:hypothetical protein
MFRFICHQRNGKLSQIIKDFKNYASEAVMREALSHITGGSLNSYEYPGKDFKRCSKSSYSWALVAYACNPSYSGGRDREDCG